MCKSLSAGGRRCTSSHRAVRAAHRALPPALGTAVAQAGPDHPAAEAYARAEEWSRKTAEAVRDGDEDKALHNSLQTRRAADDTRDLLDRRPAGAPDPDESRDNRPPAAVSDTEHRRAANALARAAGADGPVIAREDGGQSVAWNREGFAGSATVHPDGTDGHPYARVAFHDLDRDRYDALAKSPWAYTTDNGTVVYDRMPVDQAAQIIRAAADKRPGRPWQQYGLDGDGEREAIDPYYREQFVEEAEAWSSGLEGDEEIWLKQYTENSFTEINEHLYSGRGMDEDVDGYEGQSMRSIAKHLDSALATAETPEEPHRVYRGYTPPYEVRESDTVVAWVRKRFRIGRTYRDASYMSTSHDPHASVVFAHDDWYDDEAQETRFASHSVMFEIVSSKGAPLESISDYDEYERLMPRDTAYRVVGIHENVHVDGRKFCMVQLVDVDDVPRY
ncbi:ADP-ribosyltransferase [Streptacidiphilus sp. EB103A]|uniref:ADP-ribosyltransferase n=1 Tax=Streptacidiphilus sp. EB103A TaxID=3156275 RepID=UPI003512E60B